MNISQTLADPCSQLLGYGSSRGIPSGGMDGDNAELFAAIKENEVKLFIVKRLLWSQSYKANPVSPRKTNNHVCPVNLWSQTLERREIICVGYRRVWTL